MSLPRVRLTMPDVYKPASRSGSPCPGCIRAYARTAGAAQVIFASWFAWIASVAFGYGTFFHPAISFKGEDSPAYFDWGKVIALTLMILLSLAGLIGGCGLLALRAWVRRWEAAYLLVLAMGASLCVLVAVGTVRTHMWWFWPLKPTVLFTAAFGMPYVPFLSGAFVRAATDSALPGPPKRAPVAVSEGVGDRELDG